MKNRLFILITIFIIITFILSCSKKDVTGPGAPIEPIVKPETVVIEETEAESIIDVTDEYITLPDDVSPEFYEPGNVIVSAPSEQAPYGLLRKVISYSEDNGQIVVITEQATLEDLFDQLEFDIEQNLRTSDIEYSIPLIDGVYFESDTRNPYNFNYNINYVVDLANNVDLIIDGSLDLTLGYNFKVTIKLLQGLTYLNFGGFVTSEGELALGVNGSYSYEQEIPLYQHYFTPYTFFIGPVPIVLVPRVVIILQIDAYGQASVTTSVDMMASLSAGLVYRKPNWSTYQNRNISFNYNPPSIGASLNTFVGTGPRFEINLYGVAGPFVTGLGYLDLFADINATPWWILTGGFRVDAGIRFAALGFVTDYTVEGIIDYSTVIAQAAENQVATPVFNPPGGIYSEPQTVAISSITSGVTIRYTTNGNEPTENSPVYSNPVPISGSTMLKAKGFRSGMTASDTASAFYLISNAPPLEWCLVPAGNYTYGEENTILNIPYDYEIMKYEVTNSQYLEYLQMAYAAGDVHLDWDGVRGYYPGDEHTGAGVKLFYSLGTEIDTYNFARISYSNGSFILNYPDDFSGEDYLNHPVVLVSWFGAWHFAQYYGLRLPTEYEWEKAARGMTGYDYPWGLGVGTDNANYYNSGDPYDNGTTPIGIYNGETHLLNGILFSTTDSPSPYGVYDMAGNVANFTDSWFDENSRIQRGGSFLNDYIRIQTWYRTYYWPEIFFPDMGFRCVRTLN